MIYNIQVAWDQPLKDIANPMKLSILRHGIAAELGDDGSQVDSERKLTREGREKLKRVASYFCEIKISFDLILSSPFARARQTAELFSQALNCEECLRFSRHLEPGSAFKNLISEINRLSKPSDSILLVGHEPFLSQLISKLLTGHDQARITLKKGGFCFLDVQKLCDGRCAVLECLMAPRHLRSRVE